MEELTRFIVFTAGFNSQKWARKNILSVKKQNYSNFVHVVVDDATTDQTAAVIKKLSHDKMVSYRNKKNKRWIWNSITYLPKHIESEEDVIVVVDLDDWLAGPNVLKKINAIYQKDKCWLTYGSFVSASKTGKRTSKPRLRNYDIHTIQNKRYRKIKWNWWHLRTFKAFLWLKIRQDDLKGPNGKWAPYTYDKAIGFPMLEMCQPGKIKWVKDVLYIYNRANPHASARLKGRGGLGGHFRKIKPYPTLKR